MGFDLLAGFKTGDLKVELAKLREEHSARQTTFVSEKGLLETALANLTKMEEKTAFIEAQLEQLTAIPAPPKPSAEEEFSDRMDRYFTDPIYLASAGFALVGGVIAGGSQIGLNRLIKRRIGSIGKVTKAGKLGRLQAAAVASKASRASKIAKASKFSSALKLGKGIAGVGAALVAVELGVGAIVANQVNDQLRNDIANLEKGLKEADKEIKALVKARKGAEAAVDARLEEAGLGTNLELEALEEAISAYLKIMNQAIADLSGQVAKVRMVRKMSLSGAMKPDLISEVTGIAIDVVHSIAKRAEVEVMLISGRSKVEAARESGLEAEQVIEIAQIVDARNEIVAGETTERIMEILQISEALVEGEEEATMPLLAPAWAEIEGDGDLNAVGRKTVVSVSALERLQGELRAKTALAAGEDIVATAARVERSVEDVGVWNIEVAEARADVAIMKRDGTLDNPNEVAAERRLPLGLLG